MADYLLRERKGRPLPSRVRRFARRFARDTNAGPIVEFAIIVPVLLLLLLGIIDFARAFFQQNNLVAAAREGARFAAVQTDMCNAATLTAVRGRVIAYFSSVGGTAPANNSTSIPITVEPAGLCPANFNSVTTITVQIANYAFTPITPVFRLLNKTGTMNLSAKAVYRWERTP